MIRKKVEIDRKCVYSNLEDHPDVLESEREQMESGPSLIKQNYGWLSLGGAFMILSIALLFLLLRSMESIALMVSMIILTFIVGALLIAIPLLMSRHRLCSMQLVELAGRDVYDEFEFMTTDNTLDKALENSFGKDFFSKLTDKKELEVLTGRKDSLSFTTYDFSAYNSDVSSIPSRIEGTMIRVKADTGMKKSTYVASSSLSDFLSSMEKLSIGGDGLTYFGNSKDDISSHVDIKRLSALGLPYVISVTSKGINILLLGRTVDIRRIGRGAITQERYEQVVSNFDTLTYILDSISL